MLCSTNLSYCVPRASHTFPNFPSSIPVSRDAVSSKGLEIMPYNVLLHFFVYKPGVAAKHLPSALNSTKDILGQAPRERRFHIHILSS